MRATWIRPRFIFTSNLLRLGLAALLLWALAADTAPRLARLQYAALPGFDYVAEVAYLRTVGRHGEALVLAEAGLEAARSEAQAEAIRRERDLALAEQQSLWRKARDVGMGAVSGRGDSLESLVGAIAADFFIVGDVRDLALEGGRYAIDGEADKVILALSAIGMATTLAPSIDWAPAVLKIARKSGTLTRGLADQIAHLLRTGRRDELAGVLRDLRTLSAHSSPGGAVRLLRHADSADDLSALARFVERNKGGAAALHITGRDGAAMVKNAARAGETTTDAGRAVILAAAKGQHGVAWMRTGAWRTMLRPHPFVGIAKGLWKGHARSLASRVAFSLDPYIRWLVPLVAAWFFIELTLLARRLYCMAPWQSAPAIAPHRSPAPGT
jgi:hypothetical protein